MEKTLTMFLGALGAMGALVLTGCGTTKNVNVNLDYANTSLGFRNSGLLEAGSLLFWDSVENDLTVLSQDIVLVEKKVRKTKTTLKAENIEGIEFDAGVNIPGTITGSFEAEVRNNYVYEVVNAEKATNSGLFSSISAEYTRLKNMGFDAYGAWRVKRLVNNPSRYKLVLAQNPVYAESESLTFDNGGDGSFSIKTSTAQDLTFQLKAPNKSSAKCAGNPALCYISLSVWEGYLKDKLDENGDTVKSLNYRPSVDRVDKNQLSDALRRLN